jgi:hypothetical protein
MSARLLKVVTALAVLFVVLEVALPAAGAPRPLKGSATLVQVLRTVNAVLGLSKQANTNATAALKLAKSPSIGSANIRAKAVQTSDLGDGAVTGAQLAGGAVTPDKLAAGIPDSLLATIATAGKIAGSALPQIVSANIADGTITSSDIADGTVTSSDIADGTISSADIADGTIADADIGSVSASKVSGGSFTNAVLGSGGTPIKKHLATTNVLPAGLAGPIVNGTCANLGTVTVSGVAPTDTGDVVTATPIKSTQGTASGIEALSLSWNAYVSAADTVTIRVCNMGGSISIGTSLNNLDSTQHWTVSVTQH